MTQPTKPKRVRDITACFNDATTALADAEIIQAHAEDGEYSPDTNKRLVATLSRLKGKLKALNASTGRRERGLGPALTPVGAAAAKKAGARRR